jgi:hypothetical protein
MPDFGGRRFHPEDNCMAFHPARSEPLENTPSNGNQYEWNTKFRGQHVVNDQKDRPLLAPAPRSTFR